MPTHRLLRSCAVLLFALLVGSLSAQAQRRTNSSSAKIFDEKSGVVEMKMSMMGIEPTLTFYFDDYGNRTATVVRMEMQGQTLVQHSIKIGDVCTQWDDQTMEGTRTTGDETLTFTAYANMSPARKQAVNYRTLESREIAGKTASGFSIDTAGATVKVWQWHNIPLYIQAEVGGGDAIFEATSINAPSTVSPAVFTVPKGVKISNGRGR